MITKREYEVISLYAKGLTFKEIGNSLGIAMRTAINTYVRLKKKDTRRVSKAKALRNTEKLIYRQSKKAFLKKIENHRDILIQYGLFCKSPRFYLDAFRYEVVEKAQNKVHQNYFRYSLKRKK